MHRSNTIYSTSENGSGQRDWLFTGGSSIMGYGLFLLWCYKHTFRLIRHELMDWRGVDYCDVFISSLDSFWRHPFTAEDPLVSKWYNATFLQICSDFEWSGWVFLAELTLIHFLYCIHVLWIVCVFILLIFFSSDNKIMDSMPVNGFLRRCRVDCCKRLFKWQMKF